MKKIVIITPVANEESTIREQVLGIEALKIPGLEAVYVMDRVSRDGTRAILEELAAARPWLRVLFFPESTGVVSCYLRGLREALALGADRVIEMDAGLSHDPALIPLFLKKLDEGYDCVFGSRFLPGGGFSGLPVYRQWISAGGTWLANAVLGTRLTDMTSGYEGFQRRVLETMPLDDFLALGTTHFFQTEMRYYCRHRNVIEVPIVFHGSSTGMSWRELGRSLRTLWALRGRSR